MLEVLAKGLGKNVDEATVKTWFFEEGDAVTEGDDLVELATEDSVVMISVRASWRKFALMRMIRFNEMKCFASSTMMRAA